MTVAWLLTLLALAGVLFGVWGPFGSPGDDRRSSQLAAGGGGLLIGICVFWVVPELVSVSGWVITVCLLLCVAAVLTLLERSLHSNPRRHLLLPLLAATAVHSFLDGWSVRALSVRPFANVAVPIGLGLHKLPEGLALGWIGRRRLPNGPAALLTAGSVELLTLLGAFVEPRAERSGVAAFGPSWTSIVLALVGGSFLFLGLHAVVPERKKPGVLPIFAMTFAAMGLISLLRTSI